MGATASTGGDGDGTTAESLRTLLADARRPLLLGVAGDSASGKTTYTQGIRRLLGNDQVTTIPLDGSHRADRAQRRRSGRLPLDPENNHLDLVEEHLRALRRGRPVEIPRYNHRTGTFDAPEIVRPAPVVIVEGLHALYDRLQPLLDFSLYVDTDRGLKWHWKFDRDTTLRNHDPGELEGELQRREAAYLQWIDFQKTSADVVVAIGESRLGALTHDGPAEALPAHCYHVEVVTGRDTPALPAPTLRMDVADLLHGSHPPFMLATVPSLYWGRRVNVTHIDGVIPTGSLYRLETDLMAFTGISDDLERCLVEDDRQQSTLRFAQSLVAWPALCALHALVLEWRAGHGG